MDPMTLPCPVPEEQQPLNEYKELQGSWFFSWAALPVSSFAKRLIVVALFSFILISPVCLSAFSPSRSPFQFGLVSLLAALALPTLTLIQLYVGWNHVRSRLADERVFYEESGWYDGQYWTKPSEVRNQDQLVVTYEIRPLMRRIEKCFGGIAIAVVLEALIWPFL